MTLYSEIWDDTQNPGTMMDTQTFTKDDHPGIFKNKIDIILKIIDQ